MPRKPKKPVSSHRRLLSLLVYFRNMYPAYCTREEILESVPGYKEKAGGKKGAMLRMFERDKKELLRLGIPLAYISESDSYWLNNAAIQVSEFDLSPGEVAQLRAFGQLIKEIKDFDYAEEAGFLLQKISVGSVGFDESRGGYDARLDVIFSMGESSAREAEIHSALLDASLQRKRIHMRYFTAWRRQMTERDLDPYGLFYRPNQWYVVGKCHLRGREQVFRLSRISSIGPALRKKKPPHFEVPASFSLDSYKNREAWQLSREDTQEVEIWFSPKIAWQVKANWGHVGKLTTHRDGSLLMATKSNDKAAMVRWVLRFREEAKIVRPESYRELMRQTLREVILKYK